jgi:DNA helicase-2/ATP-dependent DNA helicase PcrA
MISIEQFYDALGWRECPSQEKRCVIEEGAGKPLFVVAGPGSGKTTCLTLRILKMILVDQVPAHGIIATTFAVKAADELRSRVLGWGFKLIGTLARGVIANRSCVTIGCRALYHRFLRMNMLAYADAARRTVQ